MVNERAVRSNGDLEGGMRYQHHHYQQQQQQQQAYDSSYPHYDGYDSSKKVRKAEGGGGDKGGRQLSSWLTDLSTGSFFFSGVLSSDLDGVHFRTALSRTLTADHTATLAAAAAAVALV